MGECMLGEVVGTTSCPAASNDTQACWLWDPVAPGPLAPDLAGLFFYENPGLAWELGQKGTSYPDVTRSIRPSSHPPPSFAHLYGGICALSVPG